LSYIHVSFIPSSPYGPISIKGIVVSGLTGFTLFSSPSATCKCNDVVIGGTTTPSISYDALYLNFSSVASVPTSKINCSVAMAVPPRNNTLVLDMVSAS
jgi:hypothetical protein